MKHDNKRIDFSKLKWGSFTKQEKAYERLHPGKARSLEQFAKLVEHHPKDFKKTTESRARFYLNVLKK